MSRQERFEEQTLAMLRVMWARQEQLGRCLDELDVSFAALLGVLETKGFVTMEEFAPVRKTIFEAKAKMAKALSEGNVGVPDLLADREAAQFGGKQS